MYWKMYQQFYNFLRFSQKADIHRPTYIINEIIFLHSPRHLFYIRLTSMYNFESIKKYFNI